MVAQAVMCSPVKAGLQARGGVRLSYMLERAGGEGARDRLVRPEEGKSRTRRRKTEAMMCDGKFSNVE